MEINPALEALLPSFLAQSKADGIDQLAVGCVILWEGTFLLVTRSPEEKVFPNHVEIPGGSVEPGETLLDAIVREMKEETDLDVASIETYMGSFDFTVKDGRKVRQFNFLVKPQHNAVTLHPAEHSSFCWLPLSDVSRLESMSMSGLMKKAIQDILKQVKA